MAISDRQRTKGATKGGQLIPDAHVLVYTVGRSGPHPLAAGWLMLLGFIVFAVIAAVLVGSLVFPGLLAFIVLQHFVNPPRAALGCTAGVALTDRSLLDGNPQQVLERAGFHQVVPGDATFRRVPVQLGIQRVWLPTKEFELLSGAISHAMSSPPAPPPPAPPAPAPPTA